MAKTGTSALQGVLAINEELLEKHGFVYPKEDVPVFNREGFETWDKDISLKYINCARLLNIFADLYIKLENKSFNEFLFLGTKKSDEIFDFDISAKSEDWNAFINETDRLLEESNVIYSNETLCLAPKTFIKKLYEHYKDRLKIIVYLRRQDRYLESVWAQMVASNLMNIPFEEFAMMSGYMEGVAEMLDYRKTLDYMASVVGEENLYVRVYKKKNFDGKRFNIVGDFFELLGIEDKPQMPKKQINSHISGNAIEYLRIYNSTINSLNLRSKTMDIRYERLNDYLRHVMKKGGKDLYFKPGMRQGFMNRFEEGNLYVSKKYLGGELLDSEGVSMDSPSTIRKLTEQEIENIKFMTALLMSRDD